MASRSIAPAIVQLDGDRVRASTYLGLARALLGDVINRATLGGVDVGSRTLHLPDGTAVSATISGSVNIIRIASPSPIETIIPLQFAFIVHPFTDSNPNGWWFASETATSRSSRTTAFRTKHSFAIDQDTGASVNYYHEPWRRSNAIIKSDANGKNTKIFRDLDVWPGNQWTSLDNGATVWSWWHSPHGDMALFLAIDYLPYQESFVPFLDETGALIYMTKVTAPLEWAYLAPCVFRNGELVWSFSDTDVTDYSNPITTEDYAIVGGVYPISANRFLVMIVTDKETKSTLYDVKLSPRSVTLVGSFIPPLDVDPDGNQKSDPAPFGFRWPWRFSPKGGECATLLLYYNYYPLHYQEYDVTQKLTLLIGYDPETDTFTASEKDRVDYSIYRQHDFDNVYSASGTLDPSTLILNYSGSGYYNELNVNDSSRLPIALTYDSKGNQVMAWGVLEGSSEHRTESVIDSCVVHDYYDTRNESFIVTDKRKIIVGNKEYVLIDETTQGSGSKDLHLTYLFDSDNNTYGHYSGGGTYEYTKYPKTILFLDIKTGLTILSSSYNRHNAVWVDYAWDAEIFWDYTVPYSKWDSIYYFGSHISINGQSLYDYQNNYPYSATGVLRTPNFPTVVPGSQDAHYHGVAPVFDAFRKFSGNYLPCGVVFGAAVGPTGYYIFSYDLKAWTLASWLGGAKTPRKTGNASNMSGFDAILSGISSGNLFLFPLGVSNI